MQVTGGGFEGVVVPVLFWLCWLSWLFWVFWVFLVFWVDRFWLSKVAEALKKDEFSDEFEEDTDGSPEGVPGPADSSDDIGEVGALFLSFDRKLSTTLRKVGLS